MANGRRDNRLLGRGDVKHDDGYYERSVLLGRWSGWWLLAMAYGGQRRGYEPSDHS